MKWANQRAIIMVQMGSAIFMVEMGTWVTLDGFDKKQLDICSTFGEIFGKIDLTEK